jgi:hypothetical protein
VSDITDEYGRDLVTRIGDRRLPQFHRGGVRCGILNEQARQVQELHDAIISTLDQRTLENARGVVLDVIGRIVGQDRELLNQAELEWFTPDEITGALDTAPNWVQGVSLFGNLPADDGEYLSLIRSKIFKNHVKYGSIPEILQFIKILYGINVSLRKLKLSRVQFIVPVGTAGYVTETLRRVLSDDKADNQYFLPQCPTVDIVGVMHRPEVPFAPDRETGAPDLSEAGVATA